MGEMAQLIQNYQDLKSFQYAHRLLNTLSSRQQQVLDRISYFTQE